MREKGRIVFIYKRIGQKFKLNYEHFGAAVSRKNATALPARSIQTDQRIS